MRIKEDDKWKMAFQTQYGYFKYQIMPFGLSNAPVSFQGYINKILAKKLNIFVIVYLDDILIYTEDLGKAHVDTIQWVLKELRKNGPFANFKKFRFHKDEVRFLEYVISAQGVRMEEERIDIVKNWLEPKSIYDIQVFLGFANFYCCFIHGFSRITASLTSILKMSPTSTTQKLINLVDEFGRGDRSENEAKKASASTKGPTGADYLSFDHVSYSVSNIVSNFAKNASNYLTTDAKRAFNQLCQAFIEAPIFQHFDPEQYIRVETNALKHIISGVLSQLTNDLSQWHPVDYFSFKMILAKTRYKTYDGELLAIVEAFKIWWHYLEGGKHKVFVLTDYNNLQQFMDIRRLSSQ